MRTSPCELSMNLTLAHSFQAFMCAMILERVAAFAVSRKLTPSLTPDCPQYLPVRTAIAAGVITCSISVVPAAVASASRLTAFDGLASIASFAARSHSWDGRTIGRQSMNSDDLARRSEEHTSELQPHAYIS